MRAVLALLVMGLLLAPARAEPLTIFAAASLKNAFDEIAALFEAQTGAQVVVSYAGTSILARQIERGAPADIFASANDAWTDYLVTRGLADAQSSRSIAGNQLVLVAPQTLAFDVPPDLASATDILALLGDNGRLATALVDAVPAGLYAREALHYLGTWDALAPRLAQTDNVRAAVVLVTRGEAPLGIVYASDAAAEDEVQIAARFGSETHSDIRYTASRVTDSASPLAEAFLAFLLTDQAQSVFAENSFLPAP